MFVPIEALAAKAAAKPLPVAAPAPIIKYIKEKCPPAPKCPDMRDYIRKDSIPCWGCKLK
jgi:hypothetical protein